MTAEDKLLSAISILQMHVLASETALNPEKMFGTYHMPHAGLEGVVHLLCQVWDELISEEVQP